MAQSKSIFQLYYLLIGPETKYAEARILGIKFSVYRNDNQKA